jgi:cytochrome c-type biogenesis protein CcmH/NrfG
MKFVVAMMFWLITLLLPAMLPVAAHAVMNGGSAPGATISPPAAAGSLAPQDNGEQRPVSPRNHDEWLKGSQAFEEASDWNGMLAWCQQWSKSEPNDSSAWHCLGYGYLNVKQYNDSIAAYLHAVRVNPEDADGWSNLGFVYAELKRYNDAVESYLHALRIRPGDVDCLSDLGFVYFMSGNRAGVQEISEKLRRLSPEKAGEFLQLTTQKK